MVIRHHKPLPQVRLSPQAGFHMADALAAPRVHMDSPAWEVVTDLRRIPAVTVASDVGLDEAHRFMALGGVRSLLVSDDREKVLGILTTSDILGERPVQHMEASGVSRGDLRVGDVMTRAGALDVIARADVLRAQVGDLLATLKVSGRQHALVVDEDDSGRQMIRGIVSLSQIARQLGVPLHTMEVASSFAALERVLAHAA